jgi:hypothetical protein
MTGPSAAGEVAVEHPWIVEYKRRGLTPEYRRTGHDAAGAARPRRSDG